MKPVASTSRKGSREQAPAFLVVAAIGGPRLLRDARNGCVEGVRGENGSQQVFLRTRTVATERADPISCDENLVVGAGFHTFVRDHWEALGGSPATVSFAAPSPPEAMRFYVHPVASEDVGGCLAQQLRLSVASRYGGLLPHIDVLYDAVSLRLQRYEGMSNVGDGNAPNVVVRIEFPQHERDMKATTAAAAAMPLTGTCPLS
ncbi:MAG: hypothetical protein ABIO49_14310 [Dokdonella sp.]